MINKAKTVHIYTDGACRGNPGPGGWGVVMHYNEHEKFLHGGEEHTTNNRMELTAAIEGLKALKTGCAVILTTDSQYVRQGITLWLPKWLQNGWRTSDKKPVKNADLWQALYEQAQLHEVRWDWVKGHSGHPENEKADGLANLGIDEMLQKKV